MSYLIKGKPLPHCMTDQEVAVLVARILRAEHSQTYAAVKQVARATGANTETAKKWYTGQHAPSAANLMVLMRTYPQLGEAIHKWTQPPASHQGPDRALSLSCGEAPTSIYRDNSVTINLRVRAPNIGHLNLRQLWFMSELHQGTTLRASDIATMWTVTGRTAKRDIAQLTTLGLVSFQGARKTGVYRVVPAEFATF